MTRKREGGKERRVGQDASQVPRLLALLEQSANTDDRGAEEGEYSESELSRGVRLR